MLRLADRSIPSPILRLLFLTAFSCSSAFSISGSHRAAVYPQFCGPPLHLHTKKANLDWPDLLSTSQLQQSIGLQRERERERVSAVGAVSSDKAVCSLVSTIIWAEACVLHDAACVCLYSMCCSMSDVCCVPQLHPWREEVSKFSASVFQRISMTGLIQSRKQCRQ